MESAALSYETYTLGGEAPEALLVALHYSGGRPEMWKELLEGWSVPVRVVLPRGVRPHRDGFTWFPPAHEQKAAEGKLADVERVAEQLANLIREVRRAHPEIRRVAVTGYSYGGDLAWLLAIRHPDLVDVAVPMGTRLLGDPARALPARHAILVLQGEVDPIIDADATSARVESLRRQDVPISVRVLPGLGHDLSPELVAQWRAFLEAELRAGGV